MFKRYLLLSLSLLLLCCQQVAFASEKDMEPRLQYAARIIKSTYGDTVSFQQKNKVLLKFGRNNAVGTSAATVMTLAGSEVNETYVSTNIINKISSSSTADATEVVAYEGHTCSGSGTDLKLTFISDTVTVLGQTETDLPTPVCRVTRAYNTSSTALAGSVYFYEDDTVSNGVPQTATKVHLVIPAGKQQSVKAATAFSNSDYGVCTEVYGSIIEKAAAFADFELQVRTVGGVFREQFQFAVASQGGASVFADIDPPLIVPKNSDVRLVSTADNASTVVSGGFNCYLAKVQ